MAQEKFKIRGCILRYPSGVAGQESERCASKGVTPRTRLAGRRLP